MLSWWFLYQDAGDRVFRLLFLVIHNRCHLLVTLWNMFLPWDWKWKGSWLSLFPNLVWTPQLNPISLSILPSHLYLLSILFHHNGWWLPFLRICPSLDCKILQGRDNACLCVYVCVCVCVILASRHLERSLEKGMATHLAGESHRQKSLEGYSPWGRKESDTAKHTYTPILLLGSSCIYLLVKIFDLHIYRNLWSLFVSKANHSISQ